MSDPVLDALRDAFALGGGGAKEAKNPMEAAWRWQQYSYRYTRKEKKEKAPEWETMEDGWRTQRISQSAKFVLLAVARTIEQGRAPTAANISETVGRKSSADALNWMTYGYVRKREWSMYPHNGGRVKLLFEIGEDAPLTRRRIGRRFHYFINEPPSSV